MNSLLNRIFQFLLRLRRRLLSLALRGKFEREMEEEMRFHLEMQIEQNLASGMAPEDAPQAARRQFGNQTWLKEASREMWSLNSIETLIQDLRYGARMLLKKPGFTLISVFTLALGIGANTAIFSVVNAVLLRPLPYTNPDRLVRLWETQPKFDRAPFSPGEFLDYQAQNQSFEQMAAYRWVSFTLLGTAQPMRVEAGIVSANFFDLLGAMPRRGRLLQAEDGRA